MTEARVIVRSEEGLHARPAAAFVQEALARQCRIQVESMGRTADAKSILQILSLGVKAGQEIVIRAEGDEEASAVAALVRLVETT